MPEFDVTVYEGRGRSRKNVWTGPLKEFIDGNLDFLTEVDLETLGTLTPGQMLQFHGGAHGDFEVQRVYPIPEPGMGGCVRVGSDLYPCTVVSVTPTKVTVRYDQVRRKGTSTLYIPDPAGRVEVFTWRKKHGRWAKKGLDAQCGFYFYPGARDDHFDPSF